MHGQRGGGIPLVLAHDGQVLPGIDPGKMGGVQGAGNQLAQLRARLLLPAQGGQADGNPVSGLLLLGGVLGKAPQEFLVDRQGLGGIPRLLEAPTQAPHQLPAGGALGKVLQVKADGLRGLGGPPQGQKAPNPPHLHLLPVGMPGIAPEKAVRLEDALPMESTRLQPLDEGDGFLRGEEPVLGQGEVLGGKGEGEPEEPGDSRQKERKEGGAFHSWGVTVARAMFQTSASRQRSMTRSRDWTLVSRSARKMMGWSWKATEIWRRSSRAVSSA